MSRKNPKTAPDAPVDGADATEAPDAPVDGADATEAPDAPVDGADATDPPAAGRAGPVCGRAFPG